MLVGSRCAYLSNKREKSHICVAPGCSEVSEGGGLWPNRGWVLLHHLRRCLPLTSQFPAPTWSRCVRTLRRPRGHASISRPAVTHTLLGLGWDPTCTVSSFRVFMSAASSLAQVMTPVGSLMTGRVWVPVQFRTGLTLWKYFTLTHFLVVPPPPPQGSSFIIDTIQPDLAKLKDVWLLL